MASAARKSTMNPAVLVGEMVPELVKSSGLPAGAVKYAATGVGRKNLQAAVHLTDMMAFAKGARSLHPAARVVVDLGGQGIRVLELDSAGMMTNFMTNDKCSTGTGCFLDIMAAALGVPPAEMGMASLSAKEPAVINTQCTVFAESEVVSLVAKKRPREEIIAGLNDMVAKKVAGMLTRAGMKGDILLAGGVAMNAGVVKALGRELKRPVVVPPNPNMVGALGAALAAVKP